MKKLQAGFIKAENPKNELGQVSGWLDEADRNPIEVVPWESYSYKPNVSFAIAYTEESIVIKYYVREKTILATYSQTNSPVYKNSCVELFVAFEEDESYYNLEFNCNGNCLAGFGKGKEFRTLLPARLLNKIQCISKIKNGGSFSDHDLYWELTLNIPFEVFCYHSLNSLRNKKCRMNFYKCGDELPDPHFLSWSPIQSPAPNFHLPEFFGEVEFV